MLSADCHRPQQPLCVVQTPIAPTMNARADMTQLGYLSYPPFVTPVPVPHHVYQNGFNKHGKMIGTNVGVPYPTNNHQVFKPKDLNEDQKLSQCSTPAAETPGERTPEIDEYFTAENDEGYRKWAEKKSKAEKQKGEESQLNILTHKPSKKDFRNLCSLPKNQPPRLDRLEASHYMPTKLISTNQTYGSFIDLKDNYPTITIPRQKGITSESRLISATTILPKEQTSNTLDVHNLALHDVTSQKVPYNKVIPRNIFALPSKGSVMGMREKGFTYPIYTKTGLELNRPCPAGASLFASMSQQKTHPRRAPMKNVNDSCLQRRALVPNHQAVCLPYRVRPPASVKQQPITYVCVQANGSMLC